MISVEEARAALLGLATPLPVETVPLRAAANRTLAGPLLALHDQPSFAASAMDGYAVAADTCHPGQTFEVMGESAAGHPHVGAVAQGQAVRIFTGAVLPQGAKRVLIQEDVDRDGNRITLRSNPDDARHIRPAAGDFAKGMPHHPTGPLGARDIALLAAMGHGVVPVVRRPSVAILMTGDELRAPGQALSAGQITASNGYGLAAMFDGMGAITRLLPIARDTRDSLNAAMDFATGADLLVTIGGASVGDHDLIAEVLRSRGVDMAFHKVAMRPGKPLMAGRIGDMPIVGLPGNPVSAMVCGLLFIRPMIARMLHRPDTDNTLQASLAHAIGANGPRAHYMRASMGKDGRVSVAPQQDSSLLSVLASCDTLVVRPPHDPARNAGDTVLCIPLPH
ncbi:gephyrin-like molybdotransferase Glp [Jannaschia sp. 2305UL9-9]|uniref:molybdopterin molybdotransferase MoeA n=1 Tax=Jannaschia sp. 2305UL9-9 TaxID=3121638 RepID=UPI003526FE4C